MSSPVDDRLEQAVVDVWVKRYDEARAAGLEHDDATEFAENDTDVALLRACVAGGCEPRLIARIVL